MKKTTIRIVSAMLLTVMMMLAFSSCGSGADSVISLKMSTLNPWLEDTDSSEIVKIEEIHTYYGIAPETKTMSYYSEDAEVICAYMKWLADATLSPKIIVENMGGGGSTEMVFTFKDGSTKEISIKQGLYHSFLLLFEVKSEAFLKRESMNTFYRFNVSRDEYSVYKCGDDSQPIKTVETGAGELRFIYLKDIEAPETEPTHYLDTSFGKVYIYSDSLCYIDAGEDDIYANNGYYELYGASFSELINNENVSIIEPNKGSIDRNEDGSIVLKEELIASLSKYLKDFNLCYEIPGFTLGEKIEICKNMRSPLFVKFSDECYYVAAYCPPNHKDSEYPDFCCYEEYTWVGYEKASDVKKNLGEKKIAAAFQINIQEFCRNLKTDATDVTMEHFNFYIPKFIDGVAVEPEIEFANTFIYLLGSSEKYICYSSKIAYHEPWSIECAEIDGEYYVIEPHRQEWDDGRYSEQDQRVFFGDYYDELMEIAIFDKYSVKYGTTTVSYVIFSIEDISKLMKE